MDLQRIGIKIFADKPAPVPVREFIPVFHSWIQKQAVENHLLIDVHDYSHMHQGPGILLVAQEANGRHPFVKLQRQGCRRQIPLTRRHRRHP